MRLGIDCGNFTAIPTPEQVSELVALGFSFAVVGTSYGTVSAAQIAAFTAAGALGGTGGMEVSEYQFPRSLVATTRPWWVDCETAAATIDSIRNALSRGSLGPYSRSGWWNANLPGWDVKAEFPDSQCWDARYVHGDGPCLIKDAVDGGGDVGAAIRAELGMLRPFVPYGGYTSAYITQWHDSVTVAGLNLDLNVMEEGGRMFTDAEIDAKIGAVLAALVNTNKSLDELRTNIQSTFSLALRNQTRLDIIEGKGK